MDCDTADPETRTVRRGLEQDEEHDDQSRVQEGFRRGEHSRAFHCQVGDKLKKSDDMPWWKGCQVLLDSTEFQGVQGAFPSSECTDAHVDFGHPQDRCSSTEQYDVISRTVSLDLSVNNDCLFECESFFHSKSWICEV